MNLMNFHKHIDTRILERARTYYQDNNIKELTLDDETWTAEVYGSAFYTTSVRVDIAVNL